MKKRKKKSKGYHRRKSLTQKSPSPLSSESEASRRSSLIGEQASLHKFCTPAASDSSTETASSHQSSVSPSILGSQANNVVKLDCEETVKIDSDSCPITPASPLSPASPLTVSPLSPSPKVTDQSFASGLPVQGGHYRNCYLSINRTVNNH